LRPSFEKPQRTGKRTWTGRILKIDRFGNIVTNFQVSEFPDLDRNNFSLAIGPRQIGVMAHSYAECGPGELFLIAGSSGYLEVSVGQGSAARTIGCETGAPAELTIW
jgi:S-adenosylmethionine hydrolase